MKCQVCFRQCDLQEGMHGLCKGRVMKDGKIQAENYGAITSAALDPIEKKPLAAFFPGSMILSVGSYGCNLQCPFCQNHSIAQQSLKEQCEWVTPGQLASQAEALKPYGNIGIAFTYNEPMISYEFIRDTAKLVKEKGMKTVVVTNGTASTAVLDEILPYVDAFNIDLKGFSQKYYDYVGGNFEMVLEFIRKAASQAHVEITTLIVPGKNDSESEMEQMAKWIAQNAPGAVLHLTRYFPRWKETEAPTSKETLRKLETIARKYLPQVCLGNV